MPAFRKPFRRMKLAQGIRSPSRPAPGKFACFLTGQFYGGISLAASCGAEQEAEN